MNINDPFGNMRRFPTGGEKEEQPDNETMAELAAQILKLGMETADTTSRVAKFCREADGKWRDTIGHEVLDGLAVRNIGVLCSNEEQIRFRDEVREKILSTWGHCLMAWFLVTMPGEDYVVEDEPPEDARAFLVGLFGLILEVYNRANELAGAVRENLEIKSATKVDHIMSRSAHLKAIHFSIGELVEAIADHIERVVTESAQSGGGAN